MNLVFLETWPNLMAYGDEAWFSDVAWSLAQRLRLANTIFPFIPLEKGLGLVAETLYYVPLALIFRFAGVGLLQARLLSLIAAGVAILILAYRLRGTSAWIAVAFSPSLLLAAHTARPEATGVMILIIHLLLVISDKWALVGILGGLSFFVSPVVGLWGSGAFIAWLMFSRGGWKRRLWATGLFALSLSVGLGLNALLGGPWIISYQGFTDYYVPVLRDQNPLFLLKAIAKKTYWFHLIGLRDPVITLLFAAGIISVAIRRSRVQKEELMVWLALAFGIAINGLGISRTPDYYFVYLLGPAAFAGGLGLKPLRQSLSTAILLIIGLAGLAKAFLEIRELPRSDPASKAVALRGGIPNGAGVVGHISLWYVLYDKRLIVPMFGETAKDKEEFTDRLNSLSPGFVVLTDRDTSGWVKELATEGELVRRVPFRGYGVSGKAGNAEPIRELLLYRLKPAEP